MAHMTFSQKLKRLEEIVAKLEDTDVELEEGLKLLEEGVALHKDCQKILTQSQAKITELLKSSVQEESVDQKASLSAPQDPASLDGSLFSQTDEDSVSGEAKQDKQDNELPF